MKFYNLGDKTFETDFSWNDFAFVSEMKDIYYKLGGSPLNYANVSWIRFAMAPLFG